MNVLRILFRLVWTGLAIAGEWSFIASAPPDLPGWTVITAGVLIAFVWAVIMVRSSTLLPALHAITWLVLIFFCVGFVTASFVEETPDSTVIIFFAFVIAAWLVVLWRKVSLKWPLFIALFVLLSPLASLTISIVGFIGIGKLIVQSVGRRNIYAGSYLRPDPAQIAPRGLVKGANDNA